VVAPWIQDWAARIVSKAANNTPAATTAPDIPLFQDSDLFGDLAADDIVELS
jgi:hypothetical protein